MKRLCSHRTCSYRYHLPPGLTEGELTIAVELPHVVFWVRDAAEAKDADYAIYLALGHDSRVGQGLDPVRHHLVAACKVVLLNGSLEGRVHGRVGLDAYDPRSLRRG
ncbi:hypothetical protein PpBr36_02999 [Pyricularia pennisetigena]|uniref:hypothetical protein n=1 Tax=Pyricularia pennisetigena TaxID=1578925 RepID=UPI00115215FE|nr:hypothetical protein PpBr36_02999 [Pyricularia pennisetigena]TLS31556.1 hypothetical protein PpBr36_02999 [Pyricularia pennisetigena]